MVSEGRITAVIIDDHEVVSEGVRSWCASAEPPIELIQAGTRVADAWTGRGADADVVILDLHLGASVTQELGELRRLAEAGRNVVIYTQDTDWRTAVRCIKLGALAYVAKSEGKEHLVTAVRAASNGETYTPPSLSGAIVADDDPGRLNLAPQEAEALRRWFNSSSKKIAASSMNISVKTLDTYILRARLKYDAAGRSAPTKSELMGLYATERGSRPLIGVAWIVFQSTPQCRSRRSR